MVQEVAVNWWAILAATPIPLAVGALWYSPVGFAKPWMRKAGLTEQDLSGAAATAIGFSAAAVGGFLLAWVLATVLAFAETQNAGEGMLGAFFCWLGFTASVLATNDLMERRPFSLTAINMAYWLVVAVAIGAILGAWR